MKKRNTRLPITGATDILIGRLKYTPSKSDIVRANQVHLVCIGMMATATQKNTFQHYVRSAIEWLTIDHDIVHTDPYELRIDAGFFNYNLDELKKEDVLEHNQKQTETHLIYTVWIMMFILIVNILTLILK